MGLQVLKPNAGCWENARNARDKRERERSFTNQRPFGLSRVSQKEIKIYFTK